MESLARRARSVIASDFGLAMSVEALSDRLGRAGDRVAPGPVALLRELRRHPGLFRVVDPWRGPWRAAPRRGGPERPWSSVPGLGPPGSPAPVGGVPTIAALATAAMIVPIDVEWAEGGRSLPRKLRECVYRLGRGVDAESPVAVARWARLMRGAAATQRRLAVRAGGDEGEAPRSR